MFSTTKSTVSLTSTVSGTNVTLRWAAGGGCPASNFAVRAGTAPGLSNVPVLGSALVLTTAGLPGTYYVRVVAQNAFGSSGPSNEVVVQIAGTGPSVCAQLRGSVFSAPYGDPDKALFTLQFLPTTTGRAFLNFTSFRRVGATWVDYDWYRVETQFPPGASGLFIDKPAQTSWRLELRCDGQLLAQLEGPAGR